MRRLSVAPDERPAAAPAADAGGAHPVRAPRVERPPLVPELPDVAEESGNAAEVADFFKTITAVSRAEEELVKEHRSLIDEDEQLLAQERIAPCTASFSPRNR